MLIVSFRGSAPSEYDFFSKCRLAPLFSEAAQNTAVLLVDVTQAPIRLIATRWLYDRATRTLFSSDMFTHVWRDTETGPWIVTETDSD